MMRELLLLFSLLTCWGVVLEGRTKAVLITGGASFLGRHLTHRYCSLGWHVTIIDNLSSPHALSPTLWPPHLQCPQSLLDFHSKTCSEFFQDARSQRQWDIFYHLVAINSAGAVYFRDVELPTATNQEAINWAMDNTTKPFPTHVVLFSSSMSSRYDRRETLLEENWEDQQNYCSIITEQNLQQQNYTCRSPLKITTEGNTFLEYQKRVVIFQLLPLYGDGQAAGRPFPLVLGQVLRRQDPIVLHAHTTAEEYVHMDDALDFVLDTLSAATDAHADADADAHAVSNDLTCSCGRVFALSAAGLSDPLEVLARESAALIQRGDDYAPSILVVKRGGQQHEEAKEPELAWSSARDSSSRVPEESEDEDRQEEVGGGGEGGEEEEDMAELITEIPVVLTHLAHLTEYGATFKLLIFANASAVIQCQVFCSKYELSAENCHILIAAAEQAEENYKLDLAEQHQYDMLMKQQQQQAQQAQQTPSSELDDVIPFETQQICDSRIKTCRYSHLYYDVREGRFFLNKCNENAHDENKSGASPETGGAQSAASRFRFSMQGHSIAQQITTPDSYYFSTRCIRESQARPGNSRDPTASGPGAGVDPAVVTEVYTNKTVLIARRTSPWNFGHLMVETQLPLEKLASFYQATDPDSRVVLFADDCEQSLFYGEKWGQTYNATAYHQLCHKFTQEFITPLSTSPVQYTHNLKDHVMFPSGGGDGGGQQQHDRHSGRFVRIRDAVVGVGEFSPFARVWESYDWMGLAIEVVRERMYAAYGVSDVPVRGRREEGVARDGTEGADIDIDIDIDIEAGSSHQLETRRETNRRRKLLTFIYKLGRRSVLNHEGVATFLRKWSATNGFDFIAMDCAASPLEYQVQTIAVTDILFSVGGAAAFLSLFLRPHTSFVIFPLLGMNTAGRPVIWNYIESPNIFRPLSMQNHVVFSQFYEYIKFDPHLLQARYMDVRGSDGSFIADINVLNSILLLIIGNSKNGTTP